MNLADMSPAEREKFEEELATNPEFKKFIDEMEKNDPANHPYMIAKNILDTEFELTIQYEKKQILVGKTEAGMNFIEDILQAENEGALITNDLSIIEITADVDTVVLAEEILGIGYLQKSDFKDYTISEYNRITE
jgi:hypothetical protein